MAKNELTSCFRASHAFLIGVQDYQYVTRLETPLNDVKSLAEVLRLDAHDFEVHEPLINPGKQALEHFIAHTLPGLVQPGDRVLLYFAGHGIAIDEVEQTAPKGFLLPADARKEDEDSYLSMSFLNEQLQRLPCRHLLLLLDCCFAGSFQWAAERTRGFGRYLPKNIYRQRFEYFVEQPAWQVITSAAYHQQALDVAHGYALGQRDRGKTARGANSPFATALIHALRNGAGDRAPADGLMTVSEVFSWLQDQLAQISQTHTQKPAFFPLLPRHRQGEFLFLNPKIKLHLSDYRDEFNPYRGLQAYEYEHRGTFYGRERVTGAMQQKLEGGPLLIVSGDSGAGKSSAVKAGLLPELNKQGYRHVIIRPGAHPVESLQAALQEASIMEKSVPVILLVDQLEELATQYAPEAEREEFLSALAGLIKKHDVFQKIILTVRSDFETLFEHSSLAPWWRDARYTIPGFEYEELQEIVWQPMQERCIDYEDGLAEELIREVQNRIGGLPLLSFTLSELYERFKTRRVGEDSPSRAITWEDYRVTGGVVGALQNSADEAFRNLHDNAQRVSLQHLMLRLVSLSGGETAGRRATHEELDFGDPAENERIALVRDQWIEKRLLRSGSDSQNKPFIEPAHDALVRSWRQIQDWIQEHRGENILLLAKLGAAVAEYHKQKEDKNYLWDDNPGLEQVEAMQRADALLPNRAETAFLVQSRRLKRQKRNTRNAWIIAAFVALAGLAIWALANRDDALTANKDLRSKVKEAALSNFEREKTNNRIPEAINVLQTAVGQLKPEPTPDLDSLINMWRPLGDSLVRVDSLVKISRLREAQITVMNTRKLAPDDVFLLQKLQEIDTTRKALCMDLKTKGQGFMLYGEMDTAITRFRRFMELDMENDQQVKEWQQKCTEETNSRTKKHR